MKGTIDNFLTAISIRLSKRGEILRPEPKHYSFGSKEECRAILRNGFQAVEPSIKMEWLTPYDDVVEWMTDTKGKGLLLRGSCGLGKSMILKVLCLAFEIYHGKIIKYTFARDMIKEDITHLSLYCIDDVGTEPTKNDYGEKSEVFSTIADDAEQKGKLLLLSTNLNSTEIISRYGLRTLDRLCHICQIVNFKEDNRDIQSLRR